MIEVKNALLPKSEDKRDFKLGKVFDLPKLSEIPYEFDLGAVEIMDQKQTNFCTAFAGAGALALQEGVQLVPEFMYASIGKVLGEFSLEGYELRDALKAQVKIGAIEEKDRPEGYRVGEKDEAFLADPKNWSVELFDKALEHAQSSYFDVEGQYDAFDDIRASIWLFRNEKRAVRFGVRWSWDASISYINDVKDEGGGHALYAKGWRGEYLIVPNSYGKNVGDKGIFYMHRNVVNRWVKLYGAYMTVDMTKEEYQKRLAERQNKYSVASKIISLISKVLELIGIQLTKEKVEEIKTLDEVIILMKPTIEQLAKIIEKHENVDKSLNNPGGLRYSYLQAGQIKQKLTGKPLSYFVDYATGLKALLHQIRIVCNGKSPAYTVQSKILGLKDCGELSIAQFIAIYAPRNDKNNTDLYVKIVCDGLGIEGDYKMKDFVYN